jgi:hypothetical protein
MSRSRTRKPATKIRTVRPRAWGVALNGKRRRFLFFVEAIDQEAAQTAVADAFELSHKATQTTRGPRAAGKGQSCSRAGTQPQRRAQPAPGAGAGLNFESRFLSHLTVGHATHFARVKRKAPGRRGEFRPGLGRRVMTARFRHNRADGRDRPTRQALRPRRGSAVSSLRYS